MSGDAVKLYEDEGFQLAAGHALRPGGLELTKKAVHLAGFAAGGRILDAGCGCGRTVGYLAGVAGLRAVGVDISPEMPNRARRLEAAAQVMVGDVCRLPCADGSMDGLFCECVLNLLEDRPGALAQMNRVLKPGGRLVVSDLYLREKTGDFTGLPLATCINGIAPRETVVAEIEAAGFQLMDWRDETGAYKELVAGLIMRYGSMALFWESLLGPGARACAIQDSLKNVRIGYYLSVWRRRVRAPGTGRGGAIRNDCR